MSLYEQNLSKAKAVENPSAWASLIASEPKLAESMAALRDMVLELDFDRAELLAEHVYNLVHQKRLDANVSADGVLATDGHK